jgi:hypothetical protein
MCVYMYLFFNLSELLDVACVYSVSSHWERSERKKSSSKGNDQLDTLDQITQEYK